MPRITPIHYRKLVKIFEEEEWVLVGQTGDHLQYKKRGAKRRIVVPKSKDVPVFVIKNNLRTAGIGREKCFRFLREV